MNSSITGERPTEGGQRLTHRWPPLSGLSWNICILFSANDAYMRDFRLWVPSDCIASNTEEDNRHALQQMRVVLKADIRPSTEVDPGDLDREIARETGGSPREDSPDRGG